MDDKIEIIEFLDSGKIYGYNDCDEHKIKDALNIFVKKKCLILCIGTDKYIGDCLGPLVGTYLINHNIDCPVYGTLDYPVHAVNLYNIINEINCNYPDHKVIAVDACLGASNSVGAIQIRMGSIHPGKGVGKKLPPVGDLSIVGIVDSTENSSIFPLCNIKLGMVIQMAGIIAKGICAAIPAKGY